MFKRIKHLYETPDSFFLFGLQGFYSPHLLTYFTYSVSFSFANSDSDRIVILFLQFTVRPSTVW